MCDDLPPLGANSEIEGDSKNVAHWGSIEYLTIINGRIVFYDQMSHVNKIDVRGTYFQLYFLVEIEEPLQAVELANRNFKDDQLDLARLLIVRP
jgi:hypothetical protein